MGIGCIPKGQTLVSCKWLYKLKDGLTRDGPPRYKRRLVAKGFTQRSGIDYHEVFSPMVKRSYIRVMLSLTTTLDMELDKLYVKTTFLHGS